jgi:hypothetical protein
MPVRVYEDPDSYGLWKIRQVFYGDGQERYILTRIHPSLPLSPKSNVQWRHLRLFSFTAISFTGRELNSRNICLAQVVFSKVQKASLIKSTGSRDIIHIFWQNRLFWVWIRAFIGFRTLKIILWWAVVIATFQAGWKHIWEILYLLEFAAKLFGCSPCFLLVHWINT